MKIPKKYGQSRVDYCPFCGKVGTSKNSDGIYVCKNHINSKLKDIQCLCGEWLELKSGKFGPYFSCMKCGNINFKKAMENYTESNDNERKEDNIEEKKEKKHIIKKPKETVVTSDELDFLY